MRWSEVADVRSLLEDLDTGEKSAIEDAVKAFAKAVEEKLATVCREVSVAIADCYFWGASSCEIFVECDDRRYMVVAGISARATTVHVFDMD
jgi:hypothetical protein